MSLRYGILVLLSLTYFLANGNFEPTFILDVCCGHYIMQKLGYLRLPYQLCLVSNSEETFICVNHTVRGGGANDTFMKDN